MKYYFTIVLAIFALGTSAQEISRNTVTTAGDYTVNKNGISISWSMGEVFSKTSEKGQYVTEGFQQGILEKAGKLDLKAELTETKVVQLHWEKLGKITSATFSLERQIEGSSSFKTIAIVNNEKAVNDFHFTDKSNLEGKVTYRIKYTKLDEAAYSNIQIIELPIIKLAINLFPNPTVNEINVSLKNIENLEGLTITIFRSNGQMIYFQEYETVKENQIIKIDFNEDFEAGTYIIQFLDTNNQLIDSKQFIKL
jgi:hypothetical protein